MDAKAAQLADAIRSQLGEQVNAPGIRTIKAVQMTDADAVLQSEVLKACGHCSQPRRHQPRVPMEMHAARVACSLLARLPTRLLILTEYHTQAW